MYRKLGDGQKGLKMEYTFESAMNRLDEISKLLSENSESLDKSLEPYAEGVKLIKFCNDKLNNAVITVKNIEESNDM